VTAKLKKDNTLKDIPVIALTARAMRGDRETIIASGCDDYISKPIDPDILIEKIEQWT
jgi:CheY-like chemotaxis protein